MTTTPYAVFPQAFRAAVAQVATANTARDGTGTAITVFTAGTNGSKIDHIDITAAGTTTAGVVRLFIHDGTNTRLWLERLVTAITPSTSVKSFFDTVDCSADSGSMYLPAGWSLKASTHNAETFNITAVGKDF